MHKNFPRGGEFHRVADQVHQDLPQARRIAEHLGGDVGIDMAHEVQALLPGAHRKHIQRILDAGAEVQGAALQLQFAGLDF